MNSFGSFEVSPGVLQRAPNFVDLLVRDRPGTNAYRLWGASSLENAYGTLVDSGLTGTGGAVLLEARKGGMARSLMVTKRGAGMVEECRRGQTSFQFDPEDYVATLGLNGYLMFLRIQESRDTTGWQAVPAGGPINANYPHRGPILVVPDASFFGRSASVISLQGLAPLLTGCVAGSRPLFDPTVQTPLPLHIVFPRPAATISVKNLHIGDNLLVSYGMGMPMMEVAPGTGSQPTGGGYSYPGVREVILAVEPAGEVIPFSIEVTIGMGI